MIDREKVLNGLKACSDDMGQCRNCPYRYRKALSCIYYMSKDALELLKEQSEIIDALLKVGYPHNFQREEPWIVNYMLNITDVVRKAINLRNAEEVKKDDRPQESPKGS